MCAVLGEEVGSTGESNSDSDGVPIGIIVGAVGACLAAILAAVVALLCIRQRRTKSAQESGKVSQHGSNEAHMHGPHATALSQPQVRTSGARRSEGGLEQVPPTLESIHVKSGSRDPTTGAEGGAYGDQVPGSTGTQSSVFDHAPMGSLDALSESHSDPSAVRSDSRPGLVRNIK